ncbi:MAG: hypothetical protein KAT70_03195 [Thermoplasmata archaeon]|nr:hypothetical protein [Thermoplasmata archaeon]
MARNRVRDSGGGRTKALLKRLSRHSTVLVGVQGKKAEATHKDSEDSEGEPLTVGEIASIHEFGLGVPERSWLRAWIEENRSMIQSDLRRAMQRVIEGKLTKEQAASILGVKYVGEIQKRIAQGIEPPNHPDTVKRKGSSKPLIDTGQLRSAITWVLESAL